MEGERGGRGMNCVDPLQLYFMRTPLDFSISRRLDINSLRSKFCEDGSTALRQGCQIDPIHTANTLGVKMNGSAQGCAPLQG